MATGQSGQLSLLADKVRKLQTLKNRNKKTRPGFAKGSSGSMGAKMFQGRNSQAGLNKEQETLQSPIMDQFMKQQNPKTPVTNMLRGSAY